MRLRFQYLGIRVWGLGFSICVSGFSIWELGFGVWGFDLRCTPRRAGGPTEAIIGVADRFSVCVHALTVVGLGFPVVWGLGLRISVLPV